MEVLRSSGLHYGGECSGRPTQEREKVCVCDGEENCPKDEQVEEGNTKLDNFVLNGDCDSYHEFEAGDQKSIFDSGADDSLEAYSEPKWLEQDQPMAVWVKWRGKWQAGIRCARSDWPLSTLRAKPTHGRKQYLVIFFPRARNYSWADVLLVRPINEFPEPIAYRSHNIGVNMVKDLTLARRFIMQKLAVSMINTIEQLQAKVLIETARNVVAWKDFSLEASRCKGYSDLGRMLLKLENMILQRYLNSHWIEHSLQSWVQQCQNAHSAESVEMLKEELGNAINWNGFSRLEVSRKRPKLEVRRAEVHPSSNHSLPVETDSIFFDPPTLNPPFGATQFVDLGFGSVVDTRNAQENHVKDVEATDKSKQCTAFIEAKGRQCIRWVNDGDVYCCVHLASRFSGNSAKAAAADLQMCEGTTVHGTKCKHRSLPGSSFCKKHRIHKDTGNILTFSPVNNLERKLEIASSGHFESLLQVGNKGSLFQAIDGSKTTHCIGDGVFCHETPKRHSLYCEKHFPNWLKRARDGKSRIVSKDVFTDLLKSCQSEEQKSHLHKACELFYRFFKSFLSLRNPVSKETQLQWAISEASKDIGTGKFLMKLVCSEKERLIRLWSFNANENMENSCIIEELPKVLMANYSDHEGESRLPETSSLGRITESQCSVFAKLLFPKIKKTKAFPGNREILAVALSACCKVGFQVSLEKKYGVLSERLYLKATKLCSERNIVVQWHQNGYICPNGCKPVSDSHHLCPLASLSDGWVRPEMGTLVPETSEWAMDECHYVLDFKHSKEESVEMAIILCDDISFGKESVPIACVVDEHLSGFLNGFGDGRIMPWETFTYAVKPLLDESLDLGPKISQLGCGCAHSTCLPKACDHVYLFDNDFEDAKDIYGNSMNGRFPYDEKSRIILEEGYPVYECNNNCTCSRNCKNRVLQNGVRVKLEVFKTEEKVWAVRAREPIHRGTFVCEYIGEVTDEEDASKRRRRYGREGCSSYIYEIDTHMSRVIEGEASYAIDATKYGNVSRFVDHSRTPNLESHQVLVESMDSQLSHIGLYASRDIALGEELTYDYMRKKRLQAGESFS